MMRTRLVTATAIAFSILMLSSHALAQCSGLCLYELETLDNGVSAAGASARAQDAATAFYNSAGMMRLEGTHIEFGTVLGFIDQAFELGSGTQPPLNRNPGGQVGYFIPLASAFLSTGIYEKLRFGFSFSGHYGDAVDYDNDWVGRTWVTEGTLVRLNLNPTLAYPITDWLSLGGGLNVVWVELDYQLKASRSAMAPILELDHGTRLGQGPRPLFLRQLTGRRGESAARLLGEQFRFPTGLRRQAADNIFVGFTYTFLWAANNDIHNVSVPDNVVLDGKYDLSFLHFVGVTLG